MKRLYLDEAREELNLQCDEVIQFFGSVEQNRIRGLSASGNTSALHAEIKGSTPLGSTINSEQNTFLF